MRFLFCSLNSYGFLLSAIGTAVTLQERGHEIAFVTDTMLSGALARAGFPRIPRGTPDGPSFVIDGSGSPLEILRQVRHVERALEHFPADVLVTQPPAFGPYLVAERTGLPVATQGMAVYLWPTAVPPIDPLVREFVARRYRGFALTYDSVRELLGMKQRVRGLADNPMMGDLHLLRSVPEFEGDMDSLPPQVYCVGDCLWELPEKTEPALLEWIARARDSGEPILYAQPGRSFSGYEYWPSLVEAFGNTPVRVAASVGRMNAQMGEPPENFFVRPHVPQSVVLPHTRAVISSATTTSVLGALTHGLPLLLIPTDGGEQMDVLLRCMRAGVALRLSETVASSSPERLRASVEELLAREDLQRQAAVLQDAFRRAGGHARAAALLEELGRHGRGMEHEREGTSLFPRRGPREEPDAPAPRVGGGLLS
ncbi:glycosyl transferase [Cystobacter fuscus DSM 2262]|uniref:Glycosyl transferase n=1 Tax=Cystobacter fuscus (strain ATCC 25194 / DSM 2262 / NBRC 100088 / M29) TaxID=1242864 RepID=S9Q579_CYSF2|nr:glycosyl transferase [Cystobacter fuscus]EPX56489.1 glycosyl transferase [Cystobacter fuscus DSM 2262]